MLKIKLKRKLRTQEEKYMKRDKLKRILDK